MLNEILGVTKKWKSLKTSVDAYQKVEIPSDVKELYIEVFLGTQSTPYSSNNCLSIVIPWGLDSNSRFYRTGSYYNASVNNAITIATTPSENNVYFRDAYLNGVNVDGYTKMNIAYR